LLCPFDYYLLVGSTHLSQPSYFQPIWPFVHVLCIPVLFLS
jgi:hypothetical protein